eukprot:CAMPEP_0202042208 /NCGR_PEP_ID=MMETSP0962-20130828/26564_1 /ASSEMBLY_ACC=CAM_ASM_000488 /TAXON_ID=4773 /ORGANISM="Schizochytrium aggregatum, Strain ATCC28209" /LENGTH=67 /DNA_ID=CAMNT_0048606591 /DNA_START=170 /DNA_END=370 /DNA_ORIENTATION=+
MKVAARVKSEAAHAPSAEQTTVVFNRYLELCNQRLQGAEHRRIDKEPAGALVRASVERNEDLTARSP